MILSASQTLDFLSPPPFTRHHTRSTSLPRSREQQLRELTGTTEMKFVWNKNPFFYFFYPAEDTKEERSRENEKRKENLLIQKNPENVRGGRGRRENGRGRWLSTTTTTSSSSFYQYTEQGRVQESESLPCMVLPRPCPNFQPCFCSSRCPMLS